MLAGDADRERVAEILKDAFAEGRLRQPEYEERIGRLYQARTFRDLDLLVADVPRPVPPMPPMTPWGGPVPASQSTEPYAVVALVCGVAGTMIGVSGVLAIVFGHLARRRIRATGKQGDGMALAGLVLGYVMTAVTLVVVVSGIALIGALSVALA